MAERALQCPQCSGPLTASRFARSATCSFCGATVQLDEALVSASRFRDALREWDAPTAHGHSQWISIGSTHWALGSQVGRGEISDVYAGQRARWPTERVLIKILRDPGDAPLFEREWRVIGELQESSAPGAATFLPRLPQPVTRGEIREGLHAGRPALLFRWARGFVHTFEAVQGAHRQGIEPRAAVWIWRRILEALSFVHGSGFVHGAVLPPHLLIQENEHGVRLVGLSAAGRPGEAAGVTNARFAAFYPEPFRFSKTLEPAADLAMSARCVAALLGGDPASGSVPAAVPGPLAGLIAEVAPARDPRDAWALRERLGDLAGVVFGAPAFCPVVMPR